jgi:DNA invertase Pin-like site-specific DNA recombinase
LTGSGVILRAATEPFDTGSATGRMMLQMPGVFAEFEHATIVDRLTRGIERRAREGRCLTGASHSARAVPQQDRSSRDDHSLPDHLPLL